MRIEVVNGRKLVCGHIYPTNEIKAGQVWAAADGANRTVTVVKVDGDWVKYEWEEKCAIVDHTKLAFAFQCRYCLVVE